MAAATLALDAYPGAQIEVSGGFLTLASGTYEAFSPPAAYSITLDTETVAASQTSTIEFGWRMRAGGSASVYVDRFVEVTIST